MSVASRYVEGSTLSLRGAACLAAFVWVLLLVAVIACAFRARLIRPLGAYGGECAGAIGDDCMARLVRQQEMEDVTFLLSTLIVSAIPAWSLGWVCYRMKVRSTMVFCWSCVGGVAGFLFINVFPVAFALAMLNAKPATALEAVKSVRADPQGVNKLAVYILDKRVLAASKRIMASNEVVDENALAEYASSGQPGEEWREILLKLADGTPAEEQALICLGWHGDPRNLQFLGDSLLQDNDKVASVPYQLMRNYTKDAEYYVQRCVARSPNMRVRFACARELALKGKPEGFRFYLDNLSWNKGRARANILGEMRDYIPGGKGLTDRQLPAFLAERAKQ